MPRVLISVRVDDAQIARLRAAGAATFVAARASEKLGRTVVSLGYVNRLALSQVLADRLLDASAELWNLYGPTETTVWSSIHPVSRQVHNETHEPIGRPIGRLGQRRHRVVTLRADASKMVHDRVIRAVPVQTKDSSEPVRSTVLRGAIQQSVTGLHEVPRTFHSICWQMPQDN